MARRLILPLILLVVLAGLLVYVGNDRFVQFEFLRKDALDTQLNFLSIQAVIGIAAAAILAVIALWSILVWTWRLPKRMKSGIGRKRAENGLEAVEQALLAIEAGDEAGALKKSRRAHDLLDRPALTALIAAKAAEVCGTPDEAVVHYETLIANPETQSAGLRGLARLSQNRDDNLETLARAKAAIAVSKPPKWAFDLLFKTQLALYDWAGALSTLEQAEKRKFHDKDEYRRRRAVLHCAHADSMEAVGAPAESTLREALLATDHSLSFAPGVALAARLLAANDQKKKAAGLIEKAWARAPHPALSLAYRDLWHGEPEKLITKKIKTLAKTNTGHNESDILRAEQALTSEDGVEALSQLDLLLRQEHPSARLCSLAARAETMLGNSVDARTWQIRAASAPVEADWSDLDPNGEAFNYTDEDWRRLVMSYGTSATLIHPRYETHKPRRAVTSTDTGQIASVHKSATKHTKSERSKIFEKSKAAITPENSTPPTSDNPRVGNGEDELSSRLDNLLDDKP